MEYGAMLKYLFLASFLFVTACNANIRITDVNNDKLIEYEDKDGMFFFYLKNVVNITMLRAEPFAVIRFINGSLLTITSSEDTVALLKAYGVKSDKK